MGKEQETPQGYISQIWRRRVHIAMPQGAIEGIYRSPLEWVTTDYYRWGRLNKRIGYLSTPIADPANAVERLIGSMKHNVGEPNSLIPEEVIRLPNGFHCDGGSGGEEMFRLTIPSPSADFFVASSDYDYYVLHALDKAIASISYGGFSYMQVFMPKYLLDANTLDMPIFWRSYVIGACSPLK